ncbi:hypothetical protein UT300013_08760 [Paraclostridium sordellii]
MEEIWKFIPNTNGIYEVSNFGNIKSNSVRKKGKLLKLSKTKDGYVQIRLTCNGNKFSRRVHRLVAEAFIPNPLKKEEVNNIDGNKQNNRVDNLEWCTRTENINHAFQSKLYKSREGKNNPMFGRPITDEHRKRLSESHKGFKFSEERREKLKERLLKNPPNKKSVICLNNGKIYNSGAEAERELNLPRCKVSDVCRGTRKHTKGYKFKYLTEYENDI